MNLTKSQEEYIKAIYILQNINKDVRVTDIAKKLNVSKPSVSRSIKGLDQQGAVSYKSYGSIVLTDKGSNAAKNIIKNQDTMQNFLCEILGVDKKVACEEASSLKSCLSQDTINKIDLLVEKILDLGSLCNCSETSEKCKKCIKYEVKNKLMSGRKKC